MAYDSQNPPAARSSAKQLLLALLLLGTIGCRITDVPLWSPGSTHEQKNYEVKTVRDVVYWEGPAADLHRHQLDLFLPETASDFPVVVLVHGGAWMTGDNRCCGLYSSVGQFLASQGIGVVMPNYRLSPAVKHPEHIHDVARAVAWTHRHIAEYGGCADQLFLAGHSAGGHLVALLGTDPSYLEAEGMKLSDIKGVMSICGVYHLPAGKVDVTLGGTGGDAFCIDELTPMRGDGGWCLGRSLGLPGMPLTIDVYRAVFGKDPEVREQASPVNHVRPGLPPFLIASAENDLPTLRGMAVEFRDKLRDSGCDVKLVDCAERNHSSIFFRAIDTKDPLANDMLEFIAAHRGSDKIP